MPYQGAREVKDFVKFIAEQATEPLKGYTREGKKKKVKKTEELWIANASFDMVCQQRKKKNFNAEINFEYMDLTISLLSEYDFEVYFFAMIN